MNSSSPIDIEGIYKGFLDDKQEENRIARYEGNESWYHASGAGSCSRKLYFESVEKIEKTNIIDTRTSRLLRLGTVVHLIEIIIEIIVSLLLEKKKIKIKKKKLNFMLRERFR